MSNINVRVFGVSSHRVLAWLGGWLSLALALAGYGMRTHMVLRARIGSINLKSRGACFTHNSLFFINLKS